MSFLFILLSLTLNASATNPTAANVNSTPCEERAQQVLKSLEPDNDLRHSLERGERGDCLHQSWMDTMRQFGIKQASFLIEYSWKKEHVTFRIKKISYLKNYYSHYDDSITGRKLRDIRKSGLERQLSDVVLTRVRKSVFAKRHADQVARDVFEANLLDDEALPVLDIIF